MENSKTISPESLQRYIETDKNIGYVIDEFERLEKFAAEKNLTHIRYLLQAVVEAGRQGQKDGREMILRMFPDANIFS